MSALIVILGLLVLLAACPLIAEAFRAPITQRLQTRASGAIAHLTRGATHYRWAGKAGAPIVVCIHGLSTPSYVFAATERSLVSLGYRVLSYDLYGRGLSDRVPGRQNMVFFLSQLRELLRDQGIDEPLTVLGFSMGGQIAAAFAAEEPERVNNLVLVAPSGLTTSQSVSAKPIWRAPWIGGWMMRVFGGWALRRELVEHRTTPTVIPDLEDRQAAETRTRGYLPALLSSRRHLLSTTAVAYQKRIVQADIPVLAIWGAEDPVIPLSAMGQLAQLNPQAHHAQVPGAGHNILQTHPAQVAEILRKFLHREG